jgi:hypothetical protein
MSLNLRILAYALLVLVVLALLLLLPVDAAARLDPPLGGAFSEATPCRTPGRPRERALGLNNQASTPGAGGRVWKSSEGRNRDRGFPSKISTPLVG